MTAGTGETFVKLDQVQSRSVLSPPGETACTPTGKASPGDVELRRLADLADEFNAAQIASHARSLAERVSEGRFYVACVGQFKRGKSTLLNALVGRPVLPAGIVPVTTVPTILRYGPSPSARVRFEKAEWMEIALSAVEDFVSEEKNPENAKGVLGLEIFLPSPLLSRGMCLVDTPGLGSVFAGNTEATQSFLPQIDAAIVVVGADPPLSGEELQLVETIGMEVRDLLLVMNKADRTTDMERHAAAEFTRRMLEQRLKRTAPALFEVSALDCLEGRGPARDWPRLVEALERLIEQSRASLIQAATSRGLRRTASQLLEIVREERSALQRPIEESERRIEGMREMLEKVDRAMWDLGHLLSAEQQRLSQILADRQEAFLKPAQARVRHGIAERISTVRGTRNGPKFRRAVMHLVQQIVREELLPWLKQEERFAEEAFRKTVQRFIELGNDFLRRIDREEMTEEAHLPQELSSGQGLRGRSQFSFHDIERVAAPASPFLFVSDLVTGVLGFRRRIVHDGMEFADMLLEVNSSRVQSDVDDRIRASRKELEAEIKGVLNEATAIAERALEHARTTQVAGTPAVEASLARLNAVESEVRSLCPAA